MDRIRKPLRLGWVRQAMQRIRAQRGADAPPILIRKAARSPEVTLLLRAAVVFVLVFAVFTVFLIDRAGLQDNIDGNVSLIDVLYFTMVTITTVGYGDIVPVSDQARLIDAFFVTPVRIFVWLLFLGTAYQLIIQRLIEEWRIMRLQENLDDHVILCGFGHGGSIAADELLARGWKAEHIVVVESNREEVGRAAERGFIGLHGDASSEDLAAHGGDGSCACGHRQRRPRRHDGPHRVDGAGNCEAKYASSPAFRRRRTSSSCVREVPTKSCRRRNSAAS